MGKEKIKMGGQWGRKGGREREDKTRREVQQAMPNTLIMPSHITALSCG